MARKRMIHPDFFTSASLARLDIRTMVTFAGLWIYCDDYGRGEDDPAFITAAVWPRRPDVTAEDVAEDLAALEQSGKVCRYTVGNVPFIHIPSWREHQTVSHPTPSKFPPCPRCESAVFTEWWRDDDTRTDRYRRTEKALRAARTGNNGVPTRSRTAPENLRNGSGTVREPFRSDSGLTPSQFSLVKSSSVKGTIRRVLWTTPTRLWTTLGTAAA